MKKNITFTDALKILKNINPPTTKQMGRLIKAAKQSPKTSLIDNTLKYPESLTSREQTILNNIRTKNKNTRYV